MKPLSIKLLLHFLLAFLFLNSCLAQSGQRITLVASTPVGKELQTVFNIVSTDEYDFMKWVLTLDKQQFSLDLNYGESMPNTTGFINGGKKVKITGTYTANDARIGNLSGKRYELKIAESSKMFSFLQIDEHIFQLLTKNQSLMKGNDGYSYTLNSALPVATDLKKVFMANANIAQGNTALKFAFAGRTPCDEIAKNNNLTVSEGCFKIKWSMVLNRDPQTLKPTNFKMRRINKSPDSVLGEWRVLKGIPAQPNALVYQLKTAQLTETINLLVGDDNVLFVLDKNFRLYAGNQLHSYTLNAK